MTKPETARYIRALENKADLARHIHAAGPALLAALERCVATGDLPLDLLAECQAAIRMAKEG